MRAVELFSGIGGFAAAVAGWDVQITGALDQDPVALSCYRSNFPDHPVRLVDLERISAWELTARGADLWWLSPPCQPYCERGARRDLDDYRAKSFIHLMEILARLPEGKLPQHLALENVVGFTGSLTHGRIIELLSGRGYHLRERLLCPTELGVPSRRPRYYLTASRSPLGLMQHSIPPPLTGGGQGVGETATTRNGDSFTLPLSGYLDQSLAESAPDELLVSVESIARFGSGLRILDPAEDSAQTTCFTSGYGRSLVNAGSYLTCGDRVRRFTPEEIIRLLHFPDSFSFPEGMTLRRKWGLAGNSLSVVAVREVLTAFPELLGTG
jgi:site-specific DNA-cytosine methylase